MNDWHDEGKAKNFLAPIGLILTAKIKIESA